MAYSRDRGRPARIPVDALLQCQSPASFTKSASLGFSSKYLKTFDG